MFRNFRIFRERCLYCNEYSIFKYGLCEDCCRNIRECDNYFKLLDYIDDIHVCAKYNNFVKELMIDFKYNDKTYISKIFGEMLIEKIFKLKLLREFDLITFIPEFKSDLKRRGYNQGEILSEYICKNTDFPMEELLHKTRKNRKQKDLNEAERYENVKDIFKAKKNLHNLKVLIVDDVVTTGYTLDFAAKALKEAGAKKVAAITVATRRNS